MRLLRGQRPGARAGVLLGACLLLAGCGASGTTPASPAPRARTYRMGFSAIPPRNDQAGIDPATLVSVVQVPLANYFRSKGHELWVYLDPANGLNRAGESDPLVGAGRSLTEPAIQMLFRRYAVEMDRQLHPAHMGLALETNLIRAQSPPALYAAVRRAANDAAADVRAGNASARLSVSVQVDWAWGYGSDGAFQGVATDFADDRRLPAHVHRLGCPRALAARRLDHSALCVQRARGREPPAQACAGRVGRGVRAAEEQLGYAFVARAACVAGTLLICLRSVLWHY